MEEALEDRLAVALTILKGRILLMHQIKQIHRLIYINYNS